ncbi:enoyl-CoA hydratase [Endozoicomonas arenosclerae]|uniref:enoyl-CoA hydratase n=1 Tax=Endozoicomonas arenosclerae TaxID=1633495 RepID=UPI000785A85E|nr:enoyl-CoA hydratase [Endozoicomonas arenosclerae]
MSIIVEHKNKVVLIRLNRPEALNALNTETLNELLEVMEPLDRDPEVGCFVITGSGKAFAAGADIREMSDKSFSEMFQEDFFAGWERFARLRTPKIAAVSGYALGGGCELAMMCDTLYASDNAKFGQPEIKLGVIPGIGGTQRLTRLVGKAKAMDMILTGCMITAREAEQAGMVARLFNAEDLIKETIKAAEAIAQFSKPAVMVAREAVDQALELTLNEGLLYERRVFHSLFATQDQKEGMAAFLEKRQPDFKGM